MRYALLTAGIVVNVIVVDDLDHYPAPDDAELVLVDDRPDVGIGWRLAAGDWIDDRPTPEPEPPSADELSQRAAVEYFITAGMPEDVARAAVGYAGPLA